MSNIRFEYQYRDAGGSKACGSVTFANPDNLTHEEIQTRLEEACWETEFFVADQVRIPEIFLYIEEPGDDALDHCFHHLDSVVATSDLSTDLQDRSIREFVCEVESQAALGWRLFDPIKRFEISNKS